MTLYIVLPIATLALGWLLGMHCSWSLHRRDIEHGRKYLRSLDELVAGAKPGRYEIDLVLQRKPRP